VGERIPKVHGDLPLAALPRGFGKRKELGTVASERTRIPMVMTDAGQPDNPIVLANKAFLDLTVIRRTKFWGGIAAFCKALPLPPL
jgi:hypothetical protein